MPAIDIDRIDNNPHESVHGIRDDSSTRGNDLAGTKVTATYADGTTENLTWEAYDIYTNGGAKGTDIEMSYGFDWHNLSTTKALTSLRFDLQPASSVFDTTTDHADAPEGQSTPTSKDGYPFRLDPDSEGVGGDLKVTYSGIVNLKGQEAVGDLFTTMTIDFTALPGGGLLGNMRWNSDIDTMRDSGDLVPTCVPCLTRGTMVTTDRGDVPVESLTAGSKVLTQDHGYQELVAVISRVVGSDELRRTEKLYPVRISAGSLGSGLPKRDLVVSRQHRMLAQSDIVKRMLGTDAVLIAAIKLTELPGVYIDTSVDGVEYFHLIFKDHEVILAEGTPTESFLVSYETQKTLNKAQRAEFASLFPGIGEVGYLRTPARAIPSGAMQKQLVRQHVKSAQQVLSI